MTEVVSVKFKSRGKTYFFDPGELQIEDGQQVVVETSKGLELADCVNGNHYTVDESIVPPLRPVVRIATGDDLRIAELCKAREKEAFGICEQKIAQHGLDMKLVDVECNFEGNKILFFFTSDGRVDFRELVKDLAGIFRTRIELRQIGVRDEAKMLGGLGICGRPFCCSQFLDDFQPVSTKMAKTQALSMNPAKISGTCGRLMCCLRYEQEAYEDLVKKVPKNGAFVETPDGYGNVAQVNLLRQKVKVVIDGGDQSPKTYDADEVAAVPGGRPKPGEPLPHVLTVKKKVVEEPEEDIWESPSLFGEIEEETVQKPAKSEKAEIGIDERQNGRRSRGDGRRRQRKQNDKKLGERKAEENLREQKAAEPALQRQKQQDEPKPESAEEQKKRSASRRRRSTGHKQAQDKQKEPEQRKRSQFPKSQQEKKTPKEQKGAAEEGRPAGEKTEKRKNNYRRRYRPKPNGDTPKAE